MSEHLKKFVEMLNEEQKRSKKTVQQITPEQIAENIPIKQIQKDPLVPLDQKFVTLKEMNEHYGLFLQRIQQQLSSLGGGGEVKFLRLDDVSRQTAADNRLLEYDATTRKVQFTSDLGPISTVSFDTSHVNSSNTVGMLSWNHSDDTLNLNHPNGVTQQIGQELYAYVRNRTGSTISNGSAVRFAGAEENGTSRLLVTPFIGNGTYPNLYGLGISTHDILDGDDGLITVWGKIRDLDTSLWNVGDILYVSPTNAGQLTNIKPTAPLNVIPIAVVLRKSSTLGEIFVRPTIEQSYSYGSFSDNQNHTAALPNTPYAIPMNTTEFSNGISINHISDSTRIITTNSGLYNFQFSTQFVSTNSSAKDVFVWARKNDIDIPHSNTRISIVGNNVYSVAAWNFIVSMDAGDNFQLMWATTDITASITSPPATAFAPSTPSTIMSVTQVAQ